MKLPKERKEKERNDSMDENLEKGREGNTYSFTVCDFNLSRVIKLLMYL